MKRRYFISYCLCVLAELLFFSCGNVTKKSTTDVDSDSIKAVTETERIVNTPLSDKQLPSADNVEYCVTVFDSAHSGELDNLKDLYENAPGIFTFRGDPKRNASFYGKIKGTPKEIVKVWTFATKYDGTVTSMGTWGGGTGWTGEPVYVHWPKELYNRFKKESPALTEDFSQDEIIVGSLCGKVYFLNYANGNRSRHELDVINPIKGSISLDPTLNGNLYVGQGIPKCPPMSQLAINLFKHQIAFTSGADRNAWLGWGAFDSSPVRLGQFLFWPGENATLYKYLITGNTIKKHSTLRYRQKRGGTAGTENSLCVYKNYGFFGNNHGHIMCVDLNTLKPIWTYDNHDDIDGSIVCEVVNDIPYLYCGCEVDRQGDKGICHFIKLNGLNGSVIWERQMPCRKLIIHEKHFDGGLYCTPLLGTGNCKDLIFAIICQPDNRKNADFMAFNKKTGETVYAIHLRTFAWSSPVGFVNENGKMYIFAGDASGYAYLIDAKEGKIIFSERIAGNFESSPVVIGNSLVVGSRGTDIMRYEIR